MLQQSDTDGFGLAVRSKLPKAKSFGEVRTIKRRSYLLMLMVNKYNNIYGGK